MAKQLMLKLLPIKQTLLKMQKISLLTKKQLIKKYKIVKTQLRKKEMHVQLLN